MDFGWGVKAFWIVVVIAVIAAVWYSKRNRPPEREAALEARVSLWTDATNATASATTE